MGEERKPKNPNNKTGIFSTSDGVPEMCLCRDGERIDDMGMGNLKLIQRPGDFCYGVDSVILADFAGRIAGLEYRKKNNIKTADLGAGNGAVSLMLAHKCPKAKILAVEVQEQAVDLANRSVILNGLKERIEVTRSDILDLPESLMGTMDLVVTNPPYVERGRGITGKHCSMDIARRESTADLQDFIGISAGLLKNRGSLCMVHRSFRLPDLIQEGRRVQMEAKALCPVAPALGRPANLVLVHFIKGGGKQLKFLPELHVYSNEGIHTEEIKRIYERTTQLPDKKEERKY